MPLDATENRCLDLILASLATIGTPPSGWLTGPDVIEGVPGSAIEAKDTPAIFVEHSRTDPNEAGNVGPSEHGVSLFYAFRCAAVDSRTADKLKSDVCRALFTTGEGSISAAFGTVPYLEQYGHEAGMSNAGVTVKTLLVGVDTTLSHSNP